MPTQIAWSDYLERFHCQPPAEDLAIAEFERHSRYISPADYQSFLRFADGGEGIIGRNGAYAIFWRIEDLVELNDAYEVSRYAPSLLLFGSNGGGEAFAFDRTSRLGRVVQVPFVGLHVSRASEVGATFLDLLDYLKHHEH